MKRPPTSGVPGPPPDDDHRRPNTTERGYGHRHQRMREYVLAQRPVCERCGMRASHHLHHLAYGNNVTLAEVQAVCEPCHMAIHRCERLSTE